MTSGSAVPVVPPPSTLCREDLAVGAALDRAAARLRLAGVAEARREARVLLRQSLVGQGWREFDRHALLTAGEAARLAALVGRRAAHEPVAYLRGTAEFRSLTIEVGPGVLIPRPETEVLVGEALAHLAGRAGERLRAVDMGTGSGCIAVALALSEPRVDVLAVDRSAAALSVARRNAVRLGVERRVRCVRGSFASPRWGLRLPGGWCGGVDLVVSNPPYVEPRDFALLPPDVRLWEPRAALLADGGFRNVFTRLAAGALSCVRPGGLLALEVGYGQADAVCRILAALGYEDVRRCMDLAGVPRVVLARRPAAPAGAGAAVARP